MSAGIKPDADTAVCEICGKVIPGDDFEVQRHFAKMIDFDSPGWPIMPALTGMSFYHKSCRDKERLKEKVK